LDIFKAEVIGTALLILLGDGVVAAVLLAKSKAQNSGWIVITFGWGMAVLVGAYSVVNYSGAHLNPAVTLGVAFNNGIDWSDTPKYFAGEFLGAFIGALLVYAAYLGHWEETEDPGLKLAVFCTGPAIRNPVHNLITEIIGTFVLVFGIFAVTNAQGVATNGIAVLLVALIVLSIGLSLGGPTGYAINPARDLSPRIAHFLLPIPGKGDSDWAYSWIPVSDRRSAARSAASSTTGGSRSKEGRNAEVRSRDRPGNDEHALHALRPPRAGGVGRSERARADLPEARVGRARPDGDHGAHPLGGARRGRQGRRLEGRHHRHRDHQPA